MQETTVARSYAEALFELAQADDAAELYAAQLGEIVQLIESEADFRSFLETPRIDLREKRQVLRNVLEGKIPQRLLRFLLVVVDKRRQRVLPEIALEFNKLVDQQLGRLQVDVTVAEAPDAKGRASIEKHLNTLFGVDVLPRFRADPRIIGGVIVRVGDRIMDGSIRHRLQRLRRELLRPETG